MGGRRNHAVLVVWVAITLLPRSTSHTAKSLKQNSSWVLASEVRSTPHCLGALHRCSHQSSGQSKLHSLLIASGMLLSGMGTNKQRKAKKAGAEYVLDKIDDTAVRLGKCKFERTLDAGIR